MSKLEEVLSEQSEETRQRMRALTAKVHDTEALPTDRMRAALELTDIATPLMMEAAARRELAEPKYRWVNGAKVRVNG